MTELTPEQRKTGQEANRTAVALIRAAAENDKEGTLTLAAQFTRSIDDLLPVFMALIFTAGDIAKAIDPQHHAELWARLERQIRE